MNEPVNRNAEKIQYWNRVAKESLHDNKGFSVSRHGAFLVYRQRNKSVLNLSTILIDDPDRLLEEGIRLTGRGNSCQIAKVEVEGKSYVLKRYDRRGWVYSFRHVFKRSRALRTWLAAWNLRVRGFSVADPLVCLEERRWRFLGRSYILSEYLEGRQSLTNLWSTLSDRKKQALVEQAGHLFGTLHSTGAIHGDTNWDNILVRINGMEFDFSLVDFDCSRILAHPDQRQARRDINHFLRDLARLEPTGEGLLQLFITRWQLASNFPKT